MDFARSLADHDDLKRLTNIRLIFLFNMLEVW